LKTSSFCYLGKNLCEPFLSRNFSEGWSYASHACILRLAVNCGRRTETICTARGNNIQVSLSIVRIHYAVNNGIHHYSCPGGNVVEKVLSLTKNNLALPKQIWNASYQACQCVHLQQINLPWVEPGSIPDKPQLLRLTFSTGARFLILPWIRVWWPLTTFKIVWINNLTKSSKNYLIATR